VAFTVVPQLRTGLVLAPLANEPTPALQACSATTGAADTFAMPSFLTSLATIQIASRGENVESGLPHQPGGRETIMAVWWGEHHPTACGERRISTARLAAKSNLNCGQTSN